MPFYDDELGWAYRVFLKVERLVKERLQRCLYSITGRQASEKRFVAVSSSHLLRSNAGGFPLDPLSLTFLPPLTPLTTLCVTSWNSLDSLFFSAICSKLRQKQHLYFILNLHSYRKVTLWKLKSQPSMLALHANGHLSPIL